MSPITHALTGWLIAQPMQTKRDRAVVALAAVLPDVDGLSILGGVDWYARIHHTFGHNLFAGILISGFAYKICDAKKIAAIMAFVSFHSHILGDLLGSGAGWGILYFWPVSDIIYTFSPPFQWELVSWQNFVFTVLCLILMAWMAVVKGRTIIELVSLEADRKIVYAVRKYFSVRK